jgi:hypothetical protein
VPLTPSATWCGDGYRLARLAVPAQGPAYGGSEGRCGYGCATDTEWTSAPSLIVEEKKVTTSLPVLVSSPM